MDWSTWLVTKIYEMTNSQKQSQVVVELKQGLCGPRSVTLNDWTWRFEPATETQQEVQSEAEVKLKKKNENTETKHSLDK